MGISGVENSPIKSIERNCSGFVDVNARVCAFSSSRYARNVDSFGHQNQDGGKLSSASASANSVP